jgi:hypothetical protein
MICINLFGDARQMSGSDGGIQKRIAFFIA